MKRIQSIVAVFAIAFGLSSCVISESHTVTGNPIGTKKGVVKNKAKDTKIDVSVRAAAKKGGITKIGSVDTRTTQFFSIKYETVVTGE